MNQEQDYDLNQIPSLEPDYQTANKLCIISLACELLPVILSYIFYLILGTFSQAEEALGTETMEMITNIGGIISILFIIAGIVLIIYVRIKYPQYTFGKVLMWIYIVFAVVCLVAFIVTMILCYITCTACSNSFSSCMDTCRGCD